MATRPTKKPSTSQAKKNDRLYLDGVNRLEERQGRVENAIYALKQSIDESTKIKLELDEGKAAPFAHLIGDVQRIILNKKPVKNNNWMDELKPGDARSLVNIVNPERGRPLFNVSFEGADEGTEKAIKDSRNLSTDPLEETGASAFILMTLYKYPQTDQSAFSLQCMGNEANLTEILEVMDRARAQLAGQLARTLRQNQNP